MKVHLSASAMPVFFLYTCMKIIVGYGHLVVLAMFEHSRVLCVYLCICRYVNAMYVYLRVGVCVCVCMCVCACVCAYSTCTETCTLQTLQYCLALQMSSHLVLEEALPELEYSLDLCFSNVSCKQKLRNPSQTQFSLTLSYNPNILLVVQASSHTAPSNPSSALSWLHPATFSVEERHARQLWSNSESYAYQSRNHVVRAFIQSSADRKAF